MIKKCILILIALSGCTHAPVYKAPVIEMPCEWDSEISSLDLNFEDCFIWWQHLQDPGLNELMLLAKEQNLDLQIAAIHVLQARAQANGKKGDLYPHIDGSFNSGHVSYNKKSLSDVINKRCLKKDNFNFYEIGFDAEWELDFFGMTAHEIYALKARQEAAEDCLSNVWVTLSAEIAKNYVELRSHQLRLSLLRAQIVAGANELLLIQELRQRGIVNDQAVTEIRTDQLSLQAELPTLELQISSGIHRLSILLGYAPGELFDYLSCEAPLPQLPCKTPIGIPSELLQRRPDIRKAEKELAAATEQTASAVAALFPRFSLWGFIGDIATHAGSLFTPLSTAWTIGPKIVVPIFNSKLLLQDVEYNKLTTQEALYTYQKTVLEGLEEVENAISAYIQGQKKLHYLEESYQILEQSLAQETLLFQQGVNSYLSVVKTSKQAFSAHDLLIQSEMDQLLHYIAIYKALGGNWE